MNNSAQSVWENCLDFIKDNIQPQAYKTWFEPIVAVKLDNHALSIQVPSKFFYEWLEEHYVKILKVALTKELGVNAKYIHSKTFLKAIQIDSHEMQVLRWLTNPEELLSIRY